MSTEHDWDALSEKAESGALAPVEGTALQGADAARDARETLMAATGTDSIEAATKVALGRPPLDAAGRENVTWKVRAPAQLDDIALETARREGKTLSALIRDAVAEYARAHAAPVKTAAATYYELLADLSARANQLMPHSGHDYREEPTHIAWPSAGVFAEFCRITWLASRRADDYVVVIAHSLEELAAEHSRIDNATDTLGGKLTILRGEQAAWLRRGSQFTGDTHLTELGEATHKLAAFHRELSGQDRPNWN